MLPDGRELTWGESRVFRQAYQTSEYILKKQRIVKSSLMDLPYQVRGQYYLR